MNKIYVKEHGIIPDTDCTLALYELFSNFTKDTEFVFENADYYFYPHDDVFHLE